MDTLLTLMVDEEQQSSLVVKNAYAVDNVHIIARMIMDVIVFIISFIVLIML